MDKSKKSNKSKKTMKDDEPQEQPVEEPEQTQNNSENESENESEKNTDTDNKEDSEGEGDEDSDFEYVEVDKIIQLLQLAFFHPDTGLNLCQTFTRVADSIDKNTKTVAKLLQHYETKEHSRKSKS
jgi:hypothetical protein